MGVKGHLEFSCRNFELCVNQGEVIQDSFTIYAGTADAEGDIYSSDTRMRITAQHFRGEETVVEYCFDGSCMEAGGVVKGSFTIISNQGEYTLNYRISVQKPVLQSSLGDVTNLFHFTNLAKTNWDEALELFYSPDFINIFQASEKNLLAVYLGLARFPGNSANMEEFLIEINKKSQIVYRTDIDGFSMENVLDTITRVITVTKSGWGYTNLKVTAEGSFLYIEKERLTNKDFETGVCRLEFSIDATKLHSGINIGKITISDTCTELVIPVSIMIRRGNEKLARAKETRRLALELVKVYVDMKFRKIKRDFWTIKAQKHVEDLLDTDEDNLIAKLYRVQVLLASERFNDAQWHLEELDDEVDKEDADSIAKCYYFYLTTLFNRDEGYIQEVLAEIEKACAKHPDDWRLAWLLLYMEDDYTRSPEMRWQLLEEQYVRGCSSPILLCEAVLLLETNPSLLMKLGDYEKNVLWFAAKHKMLRGNVVEQLHYLVVREKEFSPILLRTLCELYKVTKSSQTVVAICTLLILGDKTGTEYFEWYALGVALEVRVTKLYEYYMMSIPLDYQGELPKMVLMYFAYQSNLDYEHNAFLYAYIVKNREKMPDLEQNYRIAIERFVIDQIKLGHMNENLAYLYQNILAPQMLRDETAYAFTPLLFMHRIYIQNPKIVSVVVIHDKINGESIYPVADHICMLPIYGNEYALLLQDAEGNRYTRSIAYENVKLMLPEKLLPFIGTYMEGRLSFDIYQCQLDKEYITITPENEKRFKVLSESEQVIEEFKQEIRTRLLHYYYDNDKIGELDAFLEEIEPDAMAAGERAEFIQFMISRGMFEKAYQWLKSYGLAGVSLKPIARLVSRRIVANQFTEEEFLVNVAYHIFMHTRYDENILSYLMLYYKGRTSHLRDIWKAARELEMDTGQIMQKILLQMRYTNSYIREKDELLYEYSKLPDHDTALVEEVLSDTAYEYFVLDYVEDTMFFDMLYERYRQRGEADRLTKLTLLKYWSESVENRKNVMRETIVLFVEEMLQEKMFFSFYKELADVVPQLRYYLDKTFIEYKTTPGTRVFIHYCLDSDTDAEKQEYECEEMQEMYGGIYVKICSLFHGDAFQYYISEVADGEEMVTASNTIFGEEFSDSEKEGRFFEINDILVSLSMQDTVTAGQMLEEYMKKDYCTRELFRVI